MTAQRWRLTNTATDPAVLPAHQTYTHDGAADPNRQLLASDASALTSVDYLPDTADDAAAGDALHCQFVSADLGADLVYASGSVIKMALQGFEPNANCNQSLQLYAAIVDSAGTTVRRVLRSKVVHSVELSLALSNNFLSTTQDGASYTTVAGDRLVVEISVQGDPAGGGGVQGHNATLRWGGNGGGGDLPENDTETGTTLNPWIEFTTAAPSTTQVIVTTMVG